MNTKLEITLFVFLGLTVLVSFFWIFKTEQRLKKVFLGKKAKDLEDTILMLKDDVDELKKSKDTAEKEIILINAKLKKSIRGLETIRFNPFPDQGGNQSFAVSFLNEEGDGLVLSSLYARERMSVFAKPIKGGKSDYELTEEEGQVLKKAEVR